MTRAVALFGGYWKGVLRLWGILRRLFGFLALLPLTFGQSGVEASVFVIPFVPLDVYRAEGALELFDPLF